MNVLLLLVGLILFAKFEFNGSWNFCFDGKEKEICGAKRHIVCQKDYTKMAGTFLDEAPMTYHLMDTLLNKINYVRNKIAGGFQHEGDSKFPPAAKMRQLIWDNELEFFGMHRSNTCSVERSACASSPTYKQAGELIGTYGQDTKPIRFGVAFEQIFNDILDQGKHIKDKREFGRKYEDNFEENVHDLLLLANDKASRVGCGIVLCTDCTSPKGANHKFCYHLTCVFDVVCAKGCSIYEIAADDVAGTKCKDVYGENPTGEFKNLCPNDGHIHKEIKCYGPHKAWQEPQNSTSDDLAYAWGKWATGNIPDNVPTEAAPSTDDQTFGFVKLPLPPVPQKTFQEKADKIEPLYTDNPSKLCKSLKGAENTAKLLQVCPSANPTNGSHLKHTACHYPAFEPKGTVVGLYWATKYERKFLLEMHNQMRDNIASGKEYSSRGYSYYPPAARMREVIWDNELEWLAMWHAKHCVYKHDNCRGTDTFALVGQNLGFVPTSKSQGLAYTAYKALADFYNQKNSVQNPQTMPLKYSVPLHLQKENAGEFAQLAVDKISRIGCALAKCSNIHGKGGQPGYIMTCHYDAMALNDYALYKTGEPASECKSVYNLEKSANYPHLCAKSTERNKMLYWRGVDDTKGKSEADLSASFYRISCKKLALPNC